MGAIEIRVAGQSLRYSTYDKLGAIDQGAIVENKRLGHMLQVAQLVQAKRDSRVDGPSTAHRADGTRIPRTRIADSKRQRELGPEDLQKALDMVSGAVAATTLDLGASAALRASGCAAVGRSVTKAKNRERIVAQADTST